VLLGFADPTFIVGAEGDIEIDGLSAEDAVGRIAANPPVAGGDVRSVTVDGREAFEVRGIAESSTELSVATTGRSRSSPARSGSSPWTSRSGSC
jgi:hypothetical protein